MINRAKAYGHGSYGTRTLNKRAARLDPLKVDPSRTALLRRSFAAEIRKRYNRVKFLIRQLIEEDDAFGLNPPNVSPLVTASLTTNIIRRLKNGKYRLYSHSGKNLGTFPTKSQALKHERQVQYFKHASNSQVTNAKQQWKFLSKPDQLREFLKWLSETMNREIHTGGNRLDSALMHYIRMGLAKGAGRAFDDTKKPRKALAAGAEQLAFYAGTRDQFLRSAFNRPIAREKVELLASRVFTDLKGVNEATATVIQRTLADGLVQGSSPRVIGRVLAKVVDDIGIVRGTMIARTEIIRAHAEGQLIALADLGVEEVGVAVEWSTTKDGRVCPLCAPMQGVVLKLHEATGKIPRHPNCRCAWVPANVGESPIGQLRSKGAVKSALKESELPLAIDANRPTSVLNLMPSESLREFSWLLNVFCPTGKGGGIDPSCGKGTSGGAGSEPGAGASAKLDEIIARLDKVKDLAKAQGDLVGALAGVTVGKIPEAIKSVGTGAITAAKFKQQLVEKQLMKQGVPKKAARIAGCVTVALDSTLMPGSSATLSTVALANIGGPTIRAAANGIKWLRGKLGGTGGDQS